MLTDENDTSDATNLLDGVNTSVDLPEISSGGERSSSGDMSGGESSNGPPVLAGDGQGYEDWKKLVRMWAKFTKYEKKQQASVIAVKSLKGEARSIALSMPETELDSDNGVKLLLDHLDKLYLKDKDTRDYECWKKITTYRRGENASVLSYCAEFRRLRAEAKLHKIEFSDTTFGFMLLDNSNVTEEQKVLVLSIALSQVKDSNVGITPDDIQSALRRIDTSSSPATRGTNDVFMSYDNRDDGDDVADIYESIDSKALTAEEKDEIVEHALYSSYQGGNRSESSNNPNWRKKSQQQQQYHPYKQGHSSPNTFRKPWSGGSSPRNQHQQSPPALLVNPRDKQTGEVMKCLGCGSRFHLYRSLQCPKNAKSLHLTEGGGARAGDQDTLNTEHEYIFASEQDFAENDLNYGYGVIDSAATKTVCGQFWFDNFRDYLYNVNREVITSPSKIWYKFGDDGRKQAMFAATLPVHIFGRNFNLIVDVISSNCPLLMGRPSLEKLGLILDFQNSTATVEKKLFVLKRSRKGHFLASLMFSKNDLNNQVPMEIQEAKVVEIEEEETTDEMINDVHLTENPVQTVTNDVHVMEAEINTVCELVMSIVDEMDYEKTARKLHLVLGHPTIERMKKTIVSGLQGQDPQKLKLLMNAITKYTVACETCNKCAKHKPAPKVCLPMATRFDEVLAFDITYWNDPIKNQTHLILHPIDLATRLSQAVILKSKDPKHVLDKLVSCWFNVFGAPKTVYSDNGGEFANQEMVELIENMGVNYKATAAQASFSNGINERHNAILKDILTKLRIDDEHRSTPVDMLLSYAIFAKNCLIDNLGFSPHQRVFGRNPHIPNVASSNVCHTNSDYESDHVREHLNLLHKTRVAYMKAENSDRLKRALSSRIYASEAPFYYGEKVFYWKESANKSACGWKGPGTVVGTEGKVVIVRHGSFINRPHETKVRRAAEGSALQKVDEENVEKRPILDNMTFPVPSIMNDKSDTTRPVNNYDTIPVPSDVDNEISTPTTEENISVLPDQSATTSSTSAPAPSEKRVHFEESNSDTQSSTRSLRPRNNIKPAERYDDVYYYYDEDVYEASVNDEEEKAKHKELSSWKGHNVYKEVDRSEAADNLITTRWIFTDKVDENKVPYMKARLVIRGFQDKEKDAVLSESPTAHTESLKVMLALMPTLGYKPKKMDISTAFLQGKELTRPVYVKPPIEACVDETKCWLLLKGVYGLTEASRMWYERVHEVMLLGGFKRSAVDPALYFRYNGEGKVTCVLLCHVDDFLYGGISSEIDNLECLIGKHFQIREIEMNSFMYCGFQITITETEENGFEIEYSQPDKIPYIPEIKLERAGSDQSASSSKHEVRQYRSLLGALQWHANSTRPDLSFGVSRLLGETKSLMNKHCVMANKLLRKAKSCDPNKILCKKLVGSLTLNVYTDASFANLRDMGSQRGSIGFISDSAERSNLLEYKSKKIKKVCRSTFAAELLACTAALDHTLSYKSIIEAFGLKVASIYIVTDNNGLRDNLSSLVSTCEEKSLRIELAYLRETLSAEGIKVRWVRGSEQLADVLTKEKAGLDVLNFLSS